MNLPLRFRVVRSLVVVFGSLLLASSASSKVVAEPRTNAARLHDSGLLVHVASRPGNETLAPIAALPLDRPLIARLDSANSTSNALLYAPIGETVANEIGLRERAAASDSDLKYGLSLPQPGRGASIAATVALGLFFFLRRLV